MGYEKHGMSYSREYKLWGKALDRSTNQNNPRYSDYGGAGIGMSEEFMNSFTEFFRHIGKMPDDGNRYTLGRVDNTKGYIRGNVRWETHLQQCRNKGSHSTNSSGVNGVSLTLKRGTLFGVAHWVDLTGGRKSKSYSTLKYGLLPAFAMACAYREKMIKELNAAGAGYSDKHGK